jgi:hypothetical protein
MDQSAESIYKIVKFIQNSTVENKEEVFGEKYKNFKQRYPVLFEVACRKEKIDDNMLQMMLAMASKVTTNEVTQFDASAHVGQVLYDRYIDPIIASAKDDNSNEVIAKN